MKLVYPRLLLAAGVLLIAAAVVLGILAAVADGHGIVTTRVPFDGDRAPGDSPTRNLIIERKHEKQFDVSNSEEVRLVLLLNAASEASPVAGERSTYELPEGYTLVSASARLVGSAFDVQAATTEEQPPSGRDHLEWVWNVAPTRTGEQKLSLNVRLALAATDGGEGRNPEWTDNIEIKVTSPGQSFLQVIQRPVVPAITALLGSALSIPFFYTLVKERRAIT